MNKQTRTKRRVNPVKTAAQKHDAGLVLTDSPILQSLAIESSNSSGKLYRETDAVILTQPRHTAGRKPLLDVEWREHVTIRHSIHEEVCSVNSIQSCFHFFFVRKK